MLRLSALALVVTTSACQLVFPLRDRDDSDGPTDASGDGGNTTHKLVFVTSKSFPGALGGLNGADGLCQLAGTRLGGGSFKAWLSSDIEPAPGRMTQHSLPYQLPSGILVAANFDDLADGSLRSPINETELRGPHTSTDPTCHGTGVWTNTTEVGIPLGDDCMGWTMMTSTLTSNAGTSSANDAKWSDDPSCRNLPCGTGLSLYCIEQ